MRRPFDDVRGSGLSSEAPPVWLETLVDNAADVRDRFDRRLASSVAAVANPLRQRRDAAVLVLLSGPRDSATLPEDADLLLTVRASTLRNHGGQAAFPGGAADPHDDGPVDTALREAREETGLDTTRLITLATLGKAFIPPSGFHVVPVLAYSPDPGAVGVVDPAETAIVARVPLRAFINPANRLTVYRRQNARRFAGPAFLLNQMLVWGFTGQVVSALLDVAGWSQPWNADDARELDAAMTLVGGGSG